MTRDKLYEFSESDFETECNSKEGIRAMGCKLQVARKRLEMIEAIASGSATTHSYKLLAILWVIDSSQADFDQPCEDCRGPLIKGDSIRCEHCGSKIPHPADQRPERYERRQVPYCAKE